jgi:hypothetical protein
MLQWELKDDDDVDDDDFRPEDGSDMFPET